jgi:hypothetical protein
MSKNIDFTQFYTSGSVSIEDQEQQLLEDARAYYIRNGLEHPEHCLNLMQGLRMLLQEQQEAGDPYKGELTMEFTTMGQRAHYDVALFEEDEACILLYVKNWGPNPLVFPRNTMQILSASLDENSFGRKLYDIYNDIPLEDSMPSEAIQQELLTLLDLCGEVKTILSLQTHQFQFADGSSFLCLVIEAPELNDRVVIPLDIFLMIAVLSPEA